MSQAAVVAAALELARRVGIDGFSMRDLAAELGTTQMAAYHYVKGREELVTLMLDEIVSRIEVPPVESGCWHERLRTFGERHIAVLRAWPGSGALLLRHHPPRKFDQVAALIGILIDAGFEERDAVLAARLLQAWTSGELGVREYLDENPAAGLDLDTAPLRPLIARAGIGEGDVTAFALDILLDGLRARLSRTAAEGPGHGESSVCQDG